ncbi:hypothetical protein G3N56_11625 [Desulfovibrio sulfodismutans]|uniref:Uncharacterized protein n=1 Tax=Desulfolutivibrio sulfodismutans TaxID=63561 RepID=A0A7K3NMH1_9BACT|nr:hypothetical protein [Desulfolutivibrio sulfodismutans]QLA12910.1 hypothetical protein GD606_11815 [Desulfolutivibrio sulfodismutans DSM 3696]
MFKIILLQRWYNLRDSAGEECLYMSAVYPYQNF